MRIRLGPQEHEVALTILDCDGIIFDSNASKLVAFARALAEYPADAVERLLVLHKREGGVSRYLKMRQFFEEIHPVADPEPAIARALVRFGEVSEAAYSGLTPIPESLAFADAMGAPEAVVVISGADQAELRSVFASHGILDRFAEVLGSPMRKQEHARRVLFERGVPPERALFVGDGGGDFECAAELGIPFVFLTERSDWIEGESIVRAAPNAWVARTWDELSSWTS